MSKKFLLAAALVAGTATTAFAVEDMKDAEVKPAPEAAKKPMKKVTKAKKAVVKQTQTHTHAHTHKAAEPKGLTVTLGGSLDTQFGHRKQKKSYDSVLPGVLPVAETTSKTNKHAIVNDTKVSVKAEGNASGMKYGGKVVLNADSSGSKYGWNGSSVNSYYSRNDNIAHETKIWVGTKFGKLEAGTTTGAYASMHVSAASIARATGGIDGDAQYWFNPFLYNTGVTSGNNIWVPEHFMVNPNLPSNYVHGLDAHAAKVTYYTPSYSGFKLGVSYTPDSEQRGTSAKTQSVFRNVAGSTSLTGYKNMWEGGLRYKGKMDKIGFRASLTGNAAEAKNLPNIISSPAPTIQRHDLRAWEGGAAVDFMGFTLAGSYADLGKSGTAKTYNGTADLVGKKKANFWTAGLSYEHQAFGASVTYFESTHGAAAVRSSEQGSVNRILNLDSSNKYKALSFGVDYKLAPGFMPYAEVTRFELKQGKINQTSINGGDVTNVGLKKRNKNSGFVVLAGTKLQF